MSLAQRPRKPSDAAHRLRNRCRHLGVPLLATPGSFFTDPKDVKLQHLLRAIDLNTSLFQAGALRPEPRQTPGWPRRKYIKTGLPSWPEAIRATYTLAEQLAFAGPSKDLIMPPLDRKSTSASNPNQSAAQLLREEAYIGAQKALRQRLVRGCGGPGGA